MNISQYFLYVPYRIGWTLSTLFRKKKQIHFYCASHVDFVVIENIYNKIPDAEIVAKNKSVQAELMQYGIESKVYPTFPDILIMPRHTARKFPEPRMKKVGLRHGAYNFKGNVNKSRFHAFDVYFVSSENEQKQTLEDGITNTYPIGFPKLDSAFNGTWDSKKLDQYRMKLNLDSEKPVIIFTSTWNKSGMSAIDLWIDRLNELKDFYNILVTVHHWTEKKYLEKLEKNSEICFIKDKYILPYLMLSDIMIADSSSIIGDFCALDKPIITFKVPFKKRVPQAIRNMISDITIQIEEFDHLKDALKKALSNPAELSEKRKYYNKIMFDKLDGNAGQRAADKIKEQFL